MKPCLASPVSDPVSDMLNGFRSMLSIMLLVALAPLLADSAWADPGYGRLPGSQPTVDQPRADSSKAARPPVFQTGTLGLCQLYNLSGYFAINPSGEVVPLQPYCQDHQNWVWYAEGNFWRIFRRTATREAISFAQTLDQKAVEAYALSICTLLNDQTLAPTAAAQTLQTIQANGALPTAFDQAVTQAAIRAYCPGHGS